MNEVGTWRTDDGWKTYRGYIVLELEHKHDPVTPKNKTYRITTCARCDYQLRLETHNVIRWLILPP